jgi:membrane protein
MTRLEYTILTSAPVQSLIAWLKQVKPRSFEGVSLYDSLNFFRKEIFANRFNNRAKAVSFSFLMALAPLLLFLFTLIPWLPLPSGKLFKMINDTLIYLTSNVKLQQSIGKVVKDFIIQKKQGLLSFSVLLTMFYSSNGMMGLMSNFDKQLIGFRKRNIFKKRMIAIMLTLALIIAVVFALSVMLFQLWAVKTIGFAFLKKSIISKVVAYVIIIACVFITISLIYKFGTSTVTRWKLVTPGSVMATSLIVILTYVLSFLINNIVNYNQIYGSIGTLLIFMIFIHYTSQILLIGFELNVSIFVNKDIIKQREIKNNEVHRL